MCDCCFDEFFCYYLFYVMVVVSVVFMWFGMMMGVDCIIRKCCVGLFFNYVFGVNGSDV